VKDGRLVVINATYFYAGVIINEKGVVVEAAPILRWSIGKPYSVIEKFLKDKGKLIGISVMGTTN
jgi:hypothetical protein